MSGIARMRRHGGATSSNRRKTDRRPAEGTERDLAELVGILGLFIRSRGAVLDAAAGAAAAALRSGGKILIFGNGGSAAEAQHFAAELVNGLARRNGRPLPAIALSTDTSCLTAVGNDRGFDRTFSRQVEALGRAGDVAVALTTSGRSPNVVRALRSSRAKGLITIGLTGRGGGAVAPLADFLLDVPSDSTPRIQEAHLFILHELAARLEADTPVR
jgi:D-sedoheptulose 7-phosphate isomerase